MYSHYAKIYKLVTKSTSKKWKRDHATWNLFCYLETWGKHGQTYRRWIIFSCLYYTKNTNMFYISGYIICSHHCNLARIKNFKGKLWHYVITAPFYSTMSQSSNYLSSIKLSFRSASSLPAQYRPICDCFSWSSKYRFPFSASLWLSESVSDHRLTDGSGFITVVLFSVLLTDELIWFQ